ncbi:hypothetical protein LOK74_04450 [Brevibacillus humidisoli]|nr:hypothetical protein [Brevibacillus humidisoli]UFJ41762.1 hypothetical protein LOK74_04450 [Brevibacillus humidisoli]
MPDQFITSTGANTVEIRSYTMGQDAVFLVTGGEAHIGAAATAFFSEKRTFARTSYRCLAIGKGN